jgi:predicted alpha/beta-fold hydrolase
VTARIAVTVSGVVALVAGIVLLERPRAGLEITHLRAGQTPVTVMQQPGADGPLVVIAHGFAGSRQLMAAWQLTWRRRAMSRRVSISKAMAVIRCRCRGT